MTIKIIFKRKRKYLSPVSRGWVKWIWCVDLVSTVISRIIYIGWQKLSTAIFDQTKPLYLTNQNSLYFCVNQWLYMYVVKTTSTGYSGLQLLPSYIHDPCLFRASLRAALHLNWSTRGRSTLCWTNWKSPVNSSFPHPATWHLTPVPLLYKSWRLGAATCKLQSPNSKVQIFKGL